MVVAIDWCEVCGLSEIRAPLTAEGPTMLEVCSPTSGMDTLPNVVNNNSMKHPSANLEVFEFNIGKAQSLRCAGSSRAISCGECETCLLTDRMKHAKEFFPKMGDHSKKRFMLGLMRRFHSVDLLQQMVSLLQPLTCKDFTYSRSRVAPSLDTDSSTFSSDRAMDLMEVEQFVTGTWMWFQKSNYWTKANFALSLLRLCDSSLLHTLGSQARTLLISEEKATTVVPGKKLIQPHKKITPGINLIHACLATETIGICKKIYIDFWNSEIFFMC